MVLNNSLLIYFEKKLVQSKQNGVYLHHKICYICRDKVLH